MVVGKLACIAAVGVCILSALFRLNVRGLRDSVLKRFSLFGHRVARMCAPSRSGLAETLHVEIQTTEFDEPDRNGESRGIIRLLVTNNSESLIERLAVNVRLDSENCGSFLTARENYQVRLARGESATLELDVGFVSRAQLQEAYETHVQVIGSHSISCAMPMYVLPESCAGVCTIGESFGIASDVTVERIGISMKRSLFGKSGQVRVSYVVRNQGRAFHEGFSLITRLSSRSGEGIAHHATTFDIIPWGERKISFALEIDRASKLMAARFGAEFRGFKEIAVGLGSWSQLRCSPAEAASREQEEWHGEEVRDMFWFGRE